MYHRQIFKQLLTNKILKDPSQKRYFNQGDLKDLLSLELPGDEGGPGVSIVAKEARTETADIFRDVDAEILQQDVQRPAGESGRSEGATVSCRALVPTL